MTSDEKEKFDNRDFLNLTPEDREKLAKALAHKLMDLGVGILEEKTIPEPIIIHRLQVGDYTIAHQTDNGSYWITDAVGVTVRSTAEKFEKLIADFYYEES